MSPPSTVFAAPTLTNAAILGPSPAHVLLPRQTPPPTTIRDPYLAYWSLDGASISSYISDLKVLSITINGSITSWAAVKSTRAGPDSTLYVTDKVTQIDWQLHQTWTEGVNATGTRDEDHACAVETHSAVDNIWLRMECRQVVEDAIRWPNSTSTTTMTSSGAGDGPSPIVLHGNTKTTPDVTSAAVTRPSSSGASSRFPHWLGSVGAYAALVCLCVVI